MLLKSQILGWKYGHFETQTTKTDIQIKGFLHEQLRSDYWST